MDDIIVFKLPRSPPLPDFYYDSENVGQFQIVDVALEEEIKDYVTQVTMETDFYVVQTASGLLRIHSARSGLEDLESHDLLDRDDDDDDEYLNFLTLKYGDLDHRIEEYMDNYTDHHKCGL
ncbi:hypothetical protein Cantr_05941 [Candida viswanathii]|uniref:Uncharacterized protein n=1 Tax=Candida viswanathii TaxID=5486 RepID=A0A367XU40_9ASCO|nr:hypothetical protein Cantr_05941 [Candida viswanathii]